MTKFTTKNTLLLSFIFLSFTYLLSSCSQTHYPMARVEKKNVEVAIKNSNEVEKVNSPKQEVSILKNDDKEASKSEILIASDELTNNSVAIANVVTKPIAEQKAISTTSKLNWKDKMLTKKIAKIVEKQSAPAIQRGSYLYIGIVLMLVGLVIGLVFGSLGYLLVVIGLVVALLGLLTNN